MNGEINEAFCDLFTYHYGKHVLNDKECDEWDRYMMDKLQEDEITKLDPTKLDLRPHKTAQPYIMAMLFVISEKYGWKLWDRFFRVSKEYEFLSPQDYQPFSYTNFSDEKSKKHLNRFVLLLSLAANEDLKPLFEYWGFDFLDDKEVDKYYPSKKKPNQ